MSDIDDLRARMAALEATVAEQARLQALSITQSEHGERLSRIESALMSLKQGQEQIVTLLNHLIERES